MSKLYLGNFIPLFISQPNVPSDDILAVPLDIKVDARTAEILGHAKRLAEGVRNLSFEVGDAADLGCEGEFRTFTGIMNTAGRPWIMAPGNHDCFYFGNFHPVHTENWEAACRNAGEPLRKDRYVRLYVATLLHTLAHLGYTASPALFERLQTQSEAELKALLDQRIVNEQEILGTLELVGRG